MFGGVANYWANLCRYLPSDSLVVLAPEYDNSLDFDIKQNYLIYRKNFLSNSRWVWPKWLPLLYHAYKVVRSEKIKKIIVAHLLPVGTVTYVIKKFLGIPYLVSVHGLDVAYSGASKRKKRLSKTILKNADKIIANSAYTQGLLAEKYSDCPEANIIYPCPSASCQNINQERIEELRQKYNLQNKKVLLTVGRLVERKGHDKVIEALPNILRQVPSVVYLIVGNGENYKKLKQLVEKNSLQDRVLFFTDVLDSELPYFYCLADVFIMPSRRLDDGDIEGFGIVYLEANCYAKPAIAGRSGGAVEAVEHNVTGLLVDPMSVNEIAQAVISLFRNEKRAQELGERGRNRVNLRFHWAKQAEKLRKLLI